MMKVYFFIFMTFFTTGLMAEMSDGRRNTLISICDTAQKSSDLGTVRSIANQLKDAERPVDIMLGAKYDACLQIAYGEVEGSLEVDGLLAKITETAEQLHDHCRNLLYAAPEVAITNPVCKNILFK